MYVRMVTFHLNRISRKDYEAHCEEIAGAFLEWPGLVAKVWLDGQETGTYGGVYLFESKGAADLSRSTALFGGMARNTVFGGLEVREFAVLDRPTNTTARSLERPVDADW